MDKTGYLSSEAFLSVVAPVIAPVAALVLAKQCGLDFTPAVQTTALIVGGMVAAVYAICRTQLKATTMRNGSDPNPGEKP